ncbi:MAG: triose-phosphate isomerase [bacterium]|nr:triose-phosphate isomerase [bacterium]
MRRKLVAGNWKMQGRHAANAALVQGIRAREAEYLGVDLWIAPPALYIDQLAGLVVGSSICLMAQNVAREDDGACTGEISAGMLRDAACVAVIVGHSERRSRYGDDDAVVAEKFGRAQAAGLIPVLCVGETLAEREAGQTEAVVLRQLQVAIDAHGVSALASAVLAYEPVWAIGTGRTATSEQVQQVHRVLRAEVEKNDADVSAGLRILYGGSVRAANAGALFAMPDIDGALVGGASLDADEFVAIARAARVAH